MGMIKCFELTLEKKEAPQMLLSCQQSRQFDKIAIEEFGIPGVVLMENAGAACVREMLGGGIHGPTTLLCGSGNNGGDGFVIARHLINEGLPVEVLLLGNEKKLTPDARVNFEVLRQMNAKIQLANDWESADAFESSFARFGDAIPVGDDLVIVDAMLGTGAKGALRSPYCHAVAAANRCQARGVAIDIPTGLDGDTGAGEAPFRADLTCTFVAPKTGFENPSAREVLGEVAVVDIGAPRSILQRLDSDS